MHLIIEKLEYYNLKNDLSIATDRFDHCFELIQSINQRKVPILIGFDRGNLYRILKKKIAPQSPSVVKKTAQRFNVSFGRTTASNQNRSPQFKVETTLLDNEKPPSLGNINVRAKMCYGDDSSCKAAYNIDLVMASKPSKVKRKRASTRRWTVGSMQCTYCKRLGHVQDKCFLIDSNPEYANFEPNFKNNSSRLLWDLNNLLLGNPHIKFYVYFISNGSLLKAEVDTSISNLIIKMDDVYQTISRVINIDKHREHYTMMYNEVRNTFVNALKKDEIFKRLFDDIKLNGSYADNLKVSKPDEFDLVMRLKFPFEKEIKILPDTVNLGSVYIVLTRVLKRLEQTKDLVMLRFLQTKVNKKGYFLLDKFQSWLEGLFAVFLNGIHYKLRIDYDGKVCHLHYAKNGPAQTITVMSEFYEFSIDFVPAFQIEDNNGAQFHAIPRPNHSTKDNPSFKCSLAGLERRYMANRNHFKNAIRLMKKFRDMNPKMNNLKSYYIKTLFMWYAKETVADFWSKESLTGIIHVMFEKLETALKNREIKSFWNKKVNLLQDLKPSQIESMHYEVKNTRKILLAPRSGADILNIFLTYEEQRRMVPNDKKIIGKQFPPGSTTAYAAGAALLLAGLCDYFTRCENNF